MNLKKITRARLIESTREAVGIETTSTTNVVRHFREIFDRELYLKMGYSSMYLMAVEEFGYDNASAKRRTDAMELSITVPSVLEKIDSSKLGLQSAADIQKFLNQERGAKRPYSADQKIALVETCSGLTSRAVQRELASRSPIIDFKESKKLVSEDRLQITHTVSIGIEEKLQRIKDLRSHVNPYMTREELLDYMAEVTLDAIDPVRKASRAAARNEARLESRKSDDLEAKKIAQIVSDAENTEINDARPIELPEQEASEEPAFREEIINEYGEIQLVADFTRRSRYVTVESDRVLFSTYDEGCTYSDQETGRRCGSKHQLQRDHIVLFSHGGSNEYENLQLLCAKHNRWRWRNRASSVVRERVRRYG